MAKRFAFVMFGLLGVELFSGCAGDVSQADMMRNAIRRPQDEEDSEDAAPPKRVAAPIVEREVNQLTAAPSQERTRPSIAPVVTESTTGQIEVEPVTVGEQESESDNSRVQSKTGVASSIHVTEDEAFRNMERVAEALSQYAATKGYFPVQAIYDVTGIPGLSWRVELLPWLGYQSLYDDFKFDEPWDSKHNRELIKHMPDVYRSTSAGQGLTTFLLPIGTSTVAQGKRQILIRRIEDGLTNTAVLVDADDEAAVPWTEPYDFSYKVVKEENPIGTKYGTHFLAAWGNGRVSRVKNDINAKDFRAMFSIDGGENFVYRSVEYRKSPVTRRGIAAASPARSPVGTEEDSGTATGADERDTIVTPPTPVVPSLVEQLQEQARASMKSGAEGDAFALWYSSQLVSDATSDGQPMRWVAALKRPSWTLRWAIGVEFDGEKKWQGKIKPIRPETKERQKTNPPGMQQLSKLTGELGENMYWALDRSISQNVFGSLVQMDAETETVRRPNAIVGDADLPLQMRPGVLYLGAGKKWSLIKVARERRIDILIAVDVGLKSSSRGGETQTFTSIRLYDVQTQRQLVASPPLYTLKVEKDREDIALKDPVDRVIERLDQFITKDLAFTDLPELQSHHVERRIQAITDVEPQDMLATLLEIKVYREMALIDDVRFLTALQTLLGQEDGLDFLKGTPQERIHLLKNWLPAGAAPTISRSAVSGWR